MIESPGAASSQRRAFIAQRGERLRVKRFTDTKGEGWTIEINNTVIKRVRSMCEVDLLEVLDGKELIKRLMQDPITLGDVLYVVCLPQCQQRDVTDEQFGERLAGDALDEATTALLEEVVNFSPNRRDREAAQRVLTETWKTMDRARDLVQTSLQEKMDQVSSSAITKLQHELQSSNHHNELENSSCSAPASSRSTLEDSHSPS